MRFSRRSAWDREPGELARLSEQARARGLVADLTESNPTAAGLAADPAALSRALSDAGNASYEPHPQGLLPAREAISSWLAEGCAGMNVAPSRIVLTASTSEAYSLLLKLLCDPGDSVLVPEPSYPLFDMLLRLDSVTGLPHRLKLSDRWRLDVDAIGASLPETARAVLVVNPNNPTGSLLSLDEAAHLGALCKEHGLALISDEVFAAFRWKTALGIGSPRSLLPAGSAAGTLTASLSGLSKACGLPQMKLGWIALGGPDALVDEALARLDLIADTYLSVSTPMQRGLPALLAIGASFRERMSECLETNLATLRSSLPGSGCHMLPAESGWYALLSLPEGRDEHELTRMLAASDRVLVHPGWYFDLPGSHLVLSLVPTPQEFTVGLERVLARAT